MTVCLVRWHEDTGSRSAYMHSRHLCEVQIPQSIEPHVHRCACGLLKGQAEHQSAIDARNDEMERLRLRDQLVAEQLRRET